MINAKLKEDGSVGITSVFAKVITICVVQQTFIALKGKRLVSMFKISNVYEKYK